MAKLKTYVTNSGFFEMAVATSSMKAAIAAWGVSDNIFTKGFAKETHDASIVAATKDQPGVVLCRAVGTKGKFTRHAKLPDLHTLSKEKSKNRGNIKKATSSKRLSKKAAAAEKRRAEIDRRAEKREALQRQRRETSLKKAAAKFEKAQKIHLEIVDKLNSAQEAIDKQKEKEEVRWQKKIKALDNENSHI